MDFRIYYGDRTTFTHIEGLCVDGPLETAPPLNVVCVVFRDESPEPYNVGTVVLHAHEYYVYSVDCAKWIGCLNQTDWTEHVLHTNVLKSLKGRTIRDQIYHEIIAIASKDPDFPEKSAVNNRLEVGGER